MNVDIFPAEKVVINGTDIYFGFTKTDVESLLGQGDFVNTRFVKNKCYYFDGEMSIDYGDDLCVNAVEFLGGADGKIKPMLFGMSVFEASANDILSILCEKNGCEAECNEGGYSYSFHNISIGVYHEITPDDVEEMAAEMKQNGIFTENNPDLENDREKASHWWTICAGKRGYYVK